MKLQFSGHESFICKHFWLKKGFDYIYKSGNFNDESAVVQLGVGKNMVTSINYWLKAFGIIDNLGEVSELANYLFHPDIGHDPYIENFGTVCLLHYSLIKTNKASLYHIFFNEFKKGRTEFTKDQFSNFIVRKLNSEKQANIKLSTIHGDINVFLRSYLKPDYKSAKVDIEDDFSSLMIDLDFMKEYQSENADGKNVDWYKVESDVRIDLPFQIVLFIILDNPCFEKSIPFKELMSTINSPGSLFLLNEEGLYQKIQQITTRYKEITFTETAGISELQIKGQLNKWNILNEYYN